MFDQKDVKPDITASSTPVKQKADKIKIQIMHEGRGESTTFQFASSKDGIRLRLSSSNRICRKTHNQT